MGSLQLKPSDELPFDNLPQLPPEDAVPLEEVSYDPGPRLLDTSEGPANIGVMARQIPPISHRMICSEVIDLLEKQPDLSALAVVNGTKVVGLASRSTLMTTFSHPVRQALFHRRPIQALMNAKPLMVESDTGIGEVVEMITTNNQVAMGEGFLILRNGRYHGIGLMVDILRDSVARQNQHIRELENARRAAELASAAKSTFLANLSHELRTPLNAVLGFSELLSANIGGTLTDKQQEYVQDIHSSGDLLLRLINDLLDLSKADAGKMELEESVVNLDGLFEQAMRSLWPQSQQKQVELINRHRDSHFRLLGDERKLLQVMINLVANAVKFTPQGGQVYLDSEISDLGELIISVTDTGIGIAPKDLKKVMEPFGRSENAYTRDTEGTGIGLALCKAVTELHRGHLELTSQEGEGTTVKVIIPAGRVLGETLGL
ncbi:sensor histidine kinase [Rhodovibrionaceae bacterium A322]